MRRNLRPAVLTGARRSGAAAYYRAVMTDSPTGYWRLAETSGTTAANEVAGGPAGVYTGTYVQGAASLLSGIASLQLAGAGYIALASGYSYTNNFSIEALVRRTGVHGAGAIMNRRTGAYSVAVTDGGVQLGKDYVVAVGSASATLNDGLPHHVAATVDGSNNWKIYHNGGLAASGTTTAFGAGNTPFYIGADFKDSGALFESFFYGGLGEVAIYNSALGAGRILAHAQAAGLA